MTKVFVVFFLTRELPFTSNRVAILQPGLCTAEGLTEILDAGERAKRAEQPSDDKAEKAAGERAAKEAKQTRDQKRSKREEQDAQFDDQAGKPA